VAVLQGHLRHRGVRDVMVVGLSPRGGIPALGVVYLAVGNAAAIRIVLDSPPRHLAKPNDKDTPEIHVVGNVDQQHAPIKAVGE
jgi:hypothetical protein